MRGTAPKIPSVIQLDYAVSEPKPAINQEIAIVADMFSFADTLGPEKVVHI